MIPFSLDSCLLDELTAKAKVNECKRMHYDLRDSEDEESMRMLNAIEPDSVIPIHRHTKGQYHTCVSLESGSVIIEFKTTKYDKEKSEEVITMSDQLPIRDA